MERRNDSRKPMQRRASLQWPDDGTFSGVVHDLSPSGMFIETDCSHLPLHEALKVRFSLPSGSGPREFQVNAVVLRHEKNGAALAFWGMNADDTRALNDALIGTSANGTVGEPNQYGKA